MLRRIAKLKNHPRRGTIAVLACLLMVALLGMLAFSVDLSYLANSRAELQRSADASALAACYQLVYQGTPGTPVNLATNVANVPTVAARYAGLNPVCNSAPALSGSDVTTGFMADPTTPGGTINTGASQNLYNAVQVTVRRNSSENGQVPTFFGPIFGVKGQDASATSTAALIGNFGGFTSPSTRSTTKKTPSHRSA